MAGMKRKSSSTFAKSYKKARKTYKRAVKYGDVCRLRRSIRTWKENWVFSTASTPGFRKYFAPTLADVSDNAQYIALFDEYRVNSITVTFVPRYGECVVPAYGTGSALNNQFYLTVGFDRVQEVTAGAYGAATYNGTWQQCEDVKMFKLDKPVSYTYKPRIIDNASGAAKTVKMPWLMTAVTDSALIGIQAFIHDANFTGLSTSGFAVDVHYTFDIEFRGER